MVGLRPAIRFRSSLPRAGFLPIVLKQISGALLVTPITLLQVLLGGWDFLGSDSYHCSIKSNAPFQVGSVVSIRVIYWLMISHHCWLSV